MRYAAKSIKVRTPKKDNGVLTKLYTLPTMKSRLSNIIRILLGGSRHQSGPVVDLGI